ncbi:MAG: class I SAM-dependent methyltransferase [Blastocatellales bacterium]
MKTRDEHYIPALSYDWLTFLYDPVVRLTTREAAFKAALLSHARIQSGQHVLDLACGTATLTIAMKQAYPQATVVGIDGDPTILRRAQAKAQRAGVEVKFDEGLSYELPYTDASFDRVLSSLFFHHLTRENKLRTFAEVRRVLKPGGQFHVADWGAPHNALMKLASQGIVWLDGATTRDNFAGQLPEFIRQSGFEGIEETQNFNSLFGTIRLHKARKPR